MLKRTLFFNPRKPFMNISRNPRSTPGGSTISVVSSRGGVGKSTIALSLAADLARYFTVCIVDVDLRGGSIAKITGIDPPENAMTHTTPVTKDNVQDRLVTEETLNIDILPALSENVLSQDVLDTLTETYDYVVLDTPTVHFDTAVENLVYHASDYLLYVSDTQEESVESMEAWIKSATGAPQHGGMGIPANKIGVVLNKYQSKVGVRPQDVARNLHGLPVLTVVPLKVKAVVTASVNHMFEKVFETTGIRRAINRLSRSITR